MAKNLLEKLNTLVRASINDTLESGLDRLPKIRLGKNLDKEIATLHRQLEAANQDEAEMQKRLQALSQEVVRWDEAADAAVLKKQDAQARYAIEQMQRTKQRMTMLQSEIDQHQRAVYDLMKQVNQLEVVTKASQQSDDPAQETPTAKPLSEAIREARAAIGAESKPIHVRLENNENEPIEEEAVEADLAVRRARLAKPE